MNTRAGLEAAILTEPYNAAREAAYLDWLQEFEPHDLELARFGLNAMMYVCRRMHKEISLFVPNVAEVPSLCWERFRANTFLVRFSPFGVGRFIATNLTYSAPSPNEPISALATLVQV